MQPNYAPVCLFVYKRLDTLKKTVSSLMENSESASTDIYIFSDAAADEQSKNAVEEVRTFISRISGFRSVTIRNNKKNKGLANNIIEGVTSVIQVHKKVIVLEDDLVVASNFLAFMNAALSFYEKQEEMFSISGYSGAVLHPKSHDVYFTLRASSWGWATWWNRWENVDWNVSDFNAFSKNSNLQRSFNAMGSDLTRMLQKQVKGRIDSWAIRWVYHQFRMKLYTVFPMQSKVQNNGFGDEATHTAKGNRTRFTTQLDLSGRKHFAFPEKASLDPQIIRQFVAPFSLTTRIIYKLRNAFTLI
jgi:glycosyltransferase involved in cell wall biosynthesis